AMTTAGGPVVGGWLIEHVSWRAVFFLNVPLAVVVVVLSLRFMQESREPSRTSAIDWKGAALVVSGLGLLVFGLLEWPRPGARSDVVGLSLLAGVGCLVWFVAAERRTTNPMLPLGVFRSRTFTLA